MTSTTMTALVTGAAPHWVARQMPIPSPGPGQLLIRTRAVGVNNADLGALQSAAGGGSEEVAGYEFAGEVAVVGAGVVDAQVGERVMGTQPASFAEYVVADARHVLQIPEDLDDVQAAALPTGLMTEHGALAMAGFGAGQSALITGATSSIGLVGIQVARVLGATSVMATTRSRGRADLLHRVGADTVIVTDEQDLTQTALDATQGAGVDVVIDHIGGSVLAAAAAATRIDGHVVSVGRLGGDEAVLDLTVLTSRQLTLHGVSYRFDRPEQLGRAMASLEPTVMAAVTTGTVRAVVDSVHEFSAAADVVDLLRRGRVNGKVVMTLP